MGISQLARQSSALREAFICKQRGCSVQGPYFWTLFCRHSFQNGPCNCRSSRLGWPGIPALRQSTRMQPNVIAFRVCLSLLQSGLDRDTWIDDDDGNEWQMPTSLLQDPVAETVGQTAEEAAANLQQVSSEGHRHPHTLCCQPTPCLPTQSRLAKQEAACSVCAGSHHRLTRCFLIQRT